MYYVSVCFSLWLSMFCVIAIKSTVWFVTFVAQHRGVIMPLDVSAINKFLVGR